MGGWLEELELKQALRFGFGLGLCNKLGSRLSLLKLIFASKLRLPSLFMSKWGHFPVCNYFEAIFYFVENWCCLIFCWKFMSSYILLKVEVVWYFVENWGRLLFCLKFRLSLILLNKWGCIPLRTISILFRNLWLSSIFWKFEVVFHISEKFRSSSIFWKVKVLFHFFKN